MAGNTNPGHAMQSVQLVQNGISTTQYLSLILENYFVHSLEGYLQPPKV